jgi:hypothetical protein
VQLFTAWWKLVLRPGRSRPARISKLKPVLPENVSPR